MALVQTVDHPNVAVVYDSLTGALRRKIVPSRGATAPFVLEAGENHLLMRIPPFDDEACAQAVSVIVGLRR